MKKLATQARRFIRKPVKRKEPEPVFDFDEDLLGPGLFKYWKQPDKIMGYLRQRYPKPDAVGDFLKDVARIRAEL